MRDICGAKSEASGGSTASESPDSLHSTAKARILDLVSEGEIGGLVNGLQSVFLNGTPLQNPDGSSNFSGYSVDWRWGTQDQTYISGFPSVENEHAVNVELKSTQPWTQAINDLTLSAVRIMFGVPQLQQSTQDKGVIGFRIEYAIDLATDGGSFQQVLTGAFDGKTTSLYERSIRIELPAATAGWMVRIRRLTANANSSLIADTVRIESYTEIIDAKLRYPMSAIIGLQLDATQFQSVPTRSYELYGRIVKVPSNYDPVTRNYSGGWDGTFKLAWTDNPAWVTYDMVLHDRYGLGERVNASQIDKWGLYAIAQYCDVMVSDGKGGTEPRFTCNVYLQSDADAYKVLQDLAGIFRGMTYWGSEEVMVVADMPGDIAYPYTAANVIGGQFKYVGSSRSTRYTVANVTWNDPSDQYKQKVESVSDDEGIARYGVRSTSISAFGCTSQGQAQRVGKWALLTSRLEAEALTFQVGLDSTLVSPGQIFSVADPKRAGRRNGGRIKSVAGATVVLDKAPDAVQSGDTLTIVRPNGAAEKHVIKSIKGDEITVADVFASPPVPQSVWTIANADLVEQTFRAHYVSEKDGITFEISATQHAPEKFDAIDNGTRIDPKPITVIPPSVQPPPSNVRITTSEIIDQGIVRTVMTIAWDSADKGIAYQAQWRKDNGEWVTVPQTGSLSIDVIGIYQGNYVAAVRAVNALGVISIPAYSQQTALEGKTSPPPQVTFLRTTSQIFGIKLEWGFPSGADDTARTEMWYSKTVNRDDATKLSDFAYPQAMADYQGLAAGQAFFFWVRLVDRTGNIGPWYPDGAGIRGQSSSDATPILEMLTGEITKDQLSQEVLTPINAIPDIQQSISDNAAAITKEASDRVSAISAEADARAKAITAEAQARGAAITTEQQARQDADSSLGSRVDSVTAANGTNAAAIQAETKARTDADTAMGQRVDSVVATANSNTAAISDEKTARISGDSANAQAISALSTKVDASASAITSEASTRANADSAASQRMDALSATANANTAAISDEKTARVNGDTANASAISSLATKVDANTSAITNEASARTSADTAITTQLNQLSAQVNVPMAGDSGSNAGSTTVMAGVYSEQSARAEGDMANAARVDALSAQFDAATGSLRADIRTESQARADAFSAQASQITTLQSQAGANAAAVQTVAKSYADLNGRVTASYTIKTQVTSAGRTYIAGIQVGVDGSGGDVETQVLVSAGRFAILDANGTTVASPFIVQGGQVFLAQAFLGVGWITNAMIGNYIQSDNYVPGVSGWRLDKNGQFEINSSDGNGNRLQINNNGGVGWDVNGRMRYQWGFWS